MRKLVLGLVTTAMLTGCSNQLSGWFGDQVFKVMDYFVEKFKLAGENSSLQGASTSNVFTIGATYPETDLISDMYVNEFQNKTGNAALKDYFSDLMIGKLMTKESREKQLAQVTGRPVVCGFDYNLIMQTKNPDYTHTTVTLKSDDEMFDYRTQERRITAYFNNHAPLTYYVECGTEPNSCRIKSIGSVAMGIVNHCINPETNNLVGVDETGSGDSEEMIKSIIQPNTPDPKQWEGYTLIMTNAEPLLQDYLNTIEPDRYTINNVTAVTGVPLIKRVGKTYYYKVDYEFNDKYYGLKICNAGTVKWTEGTEKLELDMNCT